MDDNLMRRSYAHFSVGTGGKEPLSRKEKVRFNVGVLHS